MDFPASNILECEGLRATLCKAHTEMSYSLASITGERITLTPAGVGAQCEFCHAEEQRKRVS
jgi:hypothetical protein